jgi:anthranilate/para-aminobenzoate synthase component I
MNNKQETSLEREKLLEKLLRTHSKLKPAAEECLLSIGKIADNHQLKSFEGLLLMGKIAAEFVRLYQGNSKTTEDKDKIEDMFFTIFNTYLAFDDLEDIISEAEKFAKEKMN